MSRETLRKAGACKQAERAGKTLLPMQTLLRERTLWRGIVVEPEFAHRRVVKRDGG
jgi:hypothetical protein